MTFIHDESEVDFETMIMVNVYHEMFSWNVGPYVCEFSLVGGNLKCTLNFSDVSFQSVVLYVSFRFSLSKINSRFIEVDLSKKHLIF